MTLISPGVQVSIIDESQYIPAATNSVPYFLIATAANKASGAGVGTAAGTLPANANQTYLITSQRDLLSTFGNPKFYTDSAGNPLNGYELNEYGLLAAYSALGVTNRCYIQRVNIDLQALTASLVRPLGSPANGTYWLDTENSNWGVFEWNQVTAAFTHKAPIMFTDTSNLIGTVPNDNVGSIGDYGIVAATDATLNNPMYFKRGGADATQAQNSTYLADLFNTWVLVGSTEWETSWPTVTGVLAPTSLSSGAIIINGVSITTGNSIPVLSWRINAAGIPGIYSAVIGGKLAIFADRNANSGSAQGMVYINNDPTNTVDILQQLGINQGTYDIPTYKVAPSYQYPRWRVTDVAGKPTGSVWQKSNSVNGGASLVMKRWNTLVKSYLQQSCPLYADDASAIFGLDPTGGGMNIPEGATYAQYCAINDPSGQTSGTAQITIFERVIAGQTVVSSNTVGATFTLGDSFSITATTPNSTTLNTSVATLNHVGAGTPTANDFCAAVSAANVPHVSAAVNAAGQIVFTHDKGGVIQLVNVIGSPVADAGFDDSTPGCKPLYSAGMVIGLTLSNWMDAPIFTYYAASSAPNLNPPDGTYWYFSDATNQADIMIMNNGAWRGYLNVTNDVRGYNLSRTDANGPQFATDAPSEQSTGLPLVYGDLWIDTSDLENYPLINRWQSINGENQWVRIDNTDQTTHNGILFADARWDNSGTTDPVTGEMPAITALLRSDYVDLDAPDPDLFPEGTLLFNLRRSGYNVKKFAVNYFNNSKYPSSSLPQQRNTWLTASANFDNGAPSMGRKSQRAIIVAALKSGIDTSITAREEQLAFNLLTCPSYPELGINLVALNDERNQTAFVVGDSPLRLQPGEITNWATNSLTNPVDEPLNYASQYAGVWWPQCQTTDLTGSYVVQPASHMMVRTFLRNDQVAYPWMAAAGTRRGVVDNAVKIGFLSNETGEFTTIGVNRGIRDTLYENAINPITFIPGVGITVYGNKTITSIASALDRINVARLIVFMRTRLEYIGKQFLFEPNDQITRNEFANSVNSLCIDLVAKRALYDYLIVCDTTNNTPARIDRNELWLDLAIEPVKAVEFIYIPVRIKNTGEIAAATSV